MKLEVIVLNKVHRTQKDKCSFLLYVDPKFLILIFVWWGVGIGHETRKGPSEPVKEVLKNDYR